MPMAANPARSVRQPAGRALVGAVQPEARFAYGGSKTYRNIPIRDLARLMRHTVEARMKHYGQWTSEDDLK